MGEASLDTSVEDMVEGKGGCEVEEEGALGSWLV